MHDLKDGKCVKKTNPPKSDDSGCPTLGFKVEGGVDGKGFQVWDPQAPGGSINGQQSWPGQYSNKTKCLINEEGTMNVDLKMSQYATVNVPIGAKGLCNEPSSCGKDLSGYDGMKLTYSSTFDFDIQLRTVTVALTTVGRTAS